MFFVNEPNNKFEFKVVGYQFPGVIKDEWDDWLKIYVDVECQRGNLQQVDASLTTFELKYLIEWLEDVSLGKECSSDIIFTEPVLSFETLEWNGKKIIRTTFNNFNAAGLSFIDFEARNQSLRRIISDLKSELSNFPERCV